MLCFGFNQILFLILLFYHNKETMEHSHPFIFHNNTIKLLKTKLNLKTMCLLNKNTAPSPKESASISVGNKS